MGASESTPAKVSTEEEDLFTSDELETLHAAFAAWREAVEEERRVGSAATRRVKSDRCA